MGRMKEALIVDAERLVDEYEVTFGFICWLYQRYGDHISVEGILADNKLRYLALSAYYMEEALHESIG